MLSGDSARTDLSDRPEDLFFSEEDLLRAEGKDSAARDSMCAERWRE